MNDQNQTETLVPELDDAYECWDAIMALDTDPQFAGGTLKSAALYCKIALKSQCIAHVHTLEEALMCLDTGHDLGLTWSQSLRGVRPIGGNLFLLSEMKVAVVRRSGQCAKFKVTHSDRKSCTIAVREQGDDDDTLVTYTIEEAAASGLILADQSQWERYPRMMLYRRCASIACEQNFGHLLVPAPVQEYPEQQAGSSEPQPTAAPAATKSTRKGKAQPAVPAPEPEPAPAATPAPEPPPAAEAKVYPKITEPAFEKPAQGFAATCCPTCGMLQHNEPDGTLLCPNKHRFTKEQVAVEAAAVGDVAVHAAVPAAPAAPATASEPWMSSLDGAKTLAELKDEARKARDAGINTTKIKEVYSRNVARVSP